MLGLVLSLAACAPGSREDRGLPVRVEVVEGPGSRSARGPWVAHAIDAALERSDRLRPAHHTDRTSWSGRIELMELPDPPRLRLDFGLQGPLTKERSRPLTFEATVELTRRDERVELQRDVPLALAQAVDVLDAKVALHEGDAEAAKALLNGTDAELARLALEWAVVRHQTELLPQVLALLVHPDLEVAVEAVDAVAELGGPEHASALIASARLSDPGHTARLYQALAALGGDEARGFLSFAARNEDDPRLSELAAHALLQARTVVDEDPSPPDRPRIARGHR